MCFGRAVTALWRLAQDGLRAVRKVVLGRRFIHSLEQNQEAADRLDTALKELVERQG